MEVLNLSSNPLITEKGMFFIFTNELFANLRKLSLGGPTKGCNLGNLNLNYIKVEKILLKYLIHQNYKNSNI